MESFVGAIGDDDGRFSAAIVDGDAMGRIELAVAFAGFTEHRLPVAIFVVAMDSPGAVAIGEKEAAIGKEGVVGGHEGVASPALGGYGIFVGFVDTGIHRSAFLPDWFAFEGELGEVFQLLVAGYVEELFVPFGNDFEAMTAALELVAESADEFAVAVEDENGGVVLLLFEAFVDDVKVLVAIDSDIVGGLPGVFVRELRPIVNYLVAMFAGADDELFFGFLCGNDARGGECGGGGGSEKMTARN